MGKENWFSVFGFISKNPSPTVRYRFKLKNRLVLKPPKPSMLIFASWHHNIWFFSAVVKSIFSRVCIGLNFVTYRGWLSTFLPVKLTMSALGFFRAAVTHSCLKISENAKQRRFYSVPIALTALLLWPTALPSRPVWSSNTLPLARYALMISALHVRSRNVRCVRINRPRFDHQSSVRFPRLTRPHHSCEVYLSSFITSQLINMVRGGRSKGGKGTKDKGRGKRSAPQPSPPPSPSHQQEEQVYDEAVFIPFVYVWHSTHIREWPNPPRTSIVLSFVPVLNTFP